MGMVAGSTNKGDEAQAQSEGYICRLRVGVEGTICRATSSGSPSTFARRGSSDDTTASEETPRLRKPRSSARKRARAPSVSIQTPRPPKKSHPTACEDNSIFPQMTPPSPTRPRGPPPRPRPIPRPDAQQGCVAGPSTHGTQLCQRESLPGPTSSGAAVENTSPTGFASAQHSPSGIETLHTAESALIVSSPTHIHAPHAFEGGNGVQQQRDSSLTWAHQGFWD